MGTMVNLFIYQIISFPISILALIFTTMTDNANNIIIWLSLIIPLICYSLLIYFNNKGYYNIYILKKVVTNLNKIQEYLPSSFYHSISCFGGGSFIKIFFIFCHYVVHTTKYNCPIITKIIIKI